MRRVAILAMAYAVWVLLAISTIKFFGIRNPSFVVSLIVSVIEVGASMFVTIQILDWIRR